VAETVLPHVNEQWVRDAAREFEQEGYFGPAVSRTLDGQISLTVSAKARKEAESLRAQMAAARQPKPKIGF
jgi:hypothetical protein